MKKLVFSFGRFNPPTTGHEVLLKKVVAVAKKESADAMVYSSQSNDPKKNPLPYKEKTKFMQAMFPKHKKVIQYDVGVKNAFDTLSTVYAKGYRDVTMVVGSDRVTEFEKILNKYNDVEGRHGYYNFEGGVKVVSAGARDPDAEGVTGMSASKMRAAAAANDFESFEKGMPAGFKGGQSVFDAVRNGMNLSEEMMEFLGSDIKEFRTFMNADIIEMLDDMDDEELFESIDEDFGAVPDFATMVAFGMAAKMSVDAVKILWRTARGANKIRKWAKRNGNKLRDKVNPAPNFTQFESTGQNGLIGLDQIKKFESVVDKLFAKYDIDFNFTRHFGDRMDDSRNSPSITLKELAEFIKKMYKRQGKSIKSVAGAEAVLKDIQSDLNIPVAVTYDRNNDEFDVVLKTIMRKKNFTSPDKVIKYEENDMTSQLPEGFMDTFLGKNMKKRNSENAEQAKISKDINRKLKLIDGLMKKVKPLGGKITRMTSFRKTPIEKMTPKDMYKAINDWYLSIDDYLNDNPAVDKRHGSTVVKLYSVWEEVQAKIQDYMWASGYNVRTNIPADVIQHGRVMVQTRNIDFSAPKRTDPEWLKIDESVELDELKINMPKNMQEVKQDSDVEDKKGSQPSKYYAKDADGDKMSKSTKEKRAAYFAKGGSKKPAPGDSGAKTKESKHTKKYKKMFGETKPCWDGYTQQGMKKKGDKMVPNCVPEETVNEAKIDGLVKKSEKSGISYGILKKVYDRGMAAWKGGHRPGTTAQQWAFARVNSFVTKGKGTWGMADKDLASKVKSESVQSDNIEFYKKLFGNE
mgnify:CR=1 FL=1